jgi:hypothetical protein
MIVNTYLDESGDLGWTFDKPYRHGGSSRFLTITYFISPQVKKDIPKRFIKDIYSHFHFDVNKEIKGKDLNEIQLDYIVPKILQIIIKNQFEVGSITVKKQNVQPHIRADENKLYNYMIKLALLPDVLKYEHVNLIRDERTIKVKSGNCLIDYLQTIIWFDLHSQTTTKDIPSLSHKVLNLIFIDWISHIVWSNHEDKIGKHYAILRPYIKHIELFF